MNKKNITKIIFSLLFAVVLTLPSFVFAQDVSVDWGVDIGGDGWNISFGNGAGGFGLGNAYGLPEGSLLGIIQNILFWCLTVISMVGIIGFIIAGILYLTAAGDDGQIGKAKSAMKYSIIGVIVGISGFVVMQAAFRLLSTQVF